MAERVASAGYVAVKKQASSSVAVTPNVYVPYYEQSMVTDIHLIEDTPVFGSKFRTLQLLQGHRSHRGSLTVMAEPNTAGYLLDMLLTKGTTTGAGPYTHPFELSATTDPNYYTLDISFVSHVVRFWGVGISKLTPGFESDEMRFNIDVSALGSFYGREISSVSGSGPYTLTLKTDYDASPTTGLVVGDLIQVYDVSTNTYISCVVDALTATTIEVSEDVSAAASGDMLMLRPATPSLTLKTPFLWNRTEFRFAGTAADALTATQTRLDEGTEISIQHLFDNDDGSNRSGAFDPASLIRTVGDYTFKIKKFLDTPEEIKYWNALTKRACVMRAFSETGYEFRVTMNHIKAKTNDTPTESEGVIYHEIDYGASYDTSDAKGMVVTVINNVATI